MRLAPRRSRAPEARRTRCGRGAAPSCAPRRPHCKVLLLLMARLGIDARYQRGIARLIWASQCGIAPRCASRPSGSTNISAGKTHDNDRRFCHLHTRSPLRRQRDPLSADAHGRRIEQYSPFILPTGLQARQRWASHPKCAPQACGPFSFSAHRPIA